MTAVLAPVLLAGTTLVLSTVPALGRPSLTRRLLPHVAPTAVRPATSWRQRAALVSLVAGERLARLLGRAEPLERRLRRGHVDLDPAAFRFRQVGHAVLGLGLAGALIAALPHPPPASLAAAVVLGTPVVVVLAHEQALGRRIERHRQAVFRELPVVAEQIATHLASGRSVPATVVRLATRGRGACATDLRRVARRLQQGVDVHAGMQEWADLVHEPALSHLVAVLTLDHQAADLDLLVEREAEAIRTEAHRRLIDQLERRGQQVWVPVTVATLLPGSLLLLVPFLDALRLFAGA